MINRSVFALAFLAGAMAVAWVGIGFAGSNSLALVMTLIIAAVYLLGALEILEFRRATSSLAEALAAIPEQLPNLVDWLGRLHPSLQNPVRVRVEGERIGLPGPALTPYLVGLLVMLGMLGTFLGMVVTLDGAVSALRGTTDLQAIRAELAAPIRGLGLAFGTSVAGVAASAMLGLMSALSRRERALAAQRLDTEIATSSLRAFSLTHQRQETLRALQRQAQALPALVDKLQAMMEQMERRERQSSERLIAGQESFHSEVRAAYGSLARSVADSLNDSLSESARVAGESIKPALEAAMAGIAAETKLLHERIVGSTQAQLDTLATRLADTAQRIAETWIEMLATHRNTSEGLLGGIERSLAAFDSTFEQRSQSLLAAVGGTLSTALTNQADADRQRAEEWTGSLAAMAAALRSEWQQAGLQTLSQQERICSTLERTAYEFSAQAQADAARTRDETALLIRTASEAPQAAAELITQLRQEMTSSLERDNRLLDERARIMATLDSLLAAIDQASSEQRATIDSLVASSSALLGSAGSQFAEQLDAGSARLADVAAQVTGSAVEVASLSEAFGFAVQLFGDANEKLIASLQRIEAAMDQSTARSDEQLAYYVAQARELMDLSIMSQEKIVAELSQFAGKPAFTADQPD